MTGASPVTTILSRHDVASYAIPYVVVTGLAPVMFSTRSIIQIYYKEEICS